MSYDVASTESKLKVELERWFDADTTAWLLADMAENRDKTKVRRALLTLPLGY
jgi:hypothetical protein